MSALRALAAQASRFDFVALVRAAERVLGRAAGEFLRVTHDPRLQFQPRDVVDAEVAGEVFHVRTSFLGLYGAASPLPMTVSEAVLHAEHDEEVGPLAAVLDVLHTRALLLLYEASTKYAPAPRPSPTDAMALRLRTLSGIDPWADRSQPGLAPDVAAGLSDYRKGQVAPVEAALLQELLVHLLPGLPVVVRPRAVREVEMGEGDSPILGDPRCRLGEGLVCGVGSTDVAGLVRIEVGPVGRAELDALLPERPRWTAFREAVAWLVADAVDVELVVLVRGGETPMTTLGGGAGSVLGVDALVAADRSTPVRVTIPLADGATAADCVYREVTP